jgi:hypothetical protein
MKKQQIIDAIDANVSYYSSYYIGLTNDPDTRKQQHTNERKNTTYWKHWQADSLSDAQDIESYFIKKDMKGGFTGGDLSSQKTVYVYIF